MNTELSKVYDINQAIKNNKFTQIYFDYEKALDNTGTGKFNYIILLTCSLGLLSNGIQNGISAYILPSLKCEFNISKSQMAMINVAFMIGGIISAYTWGFLANLVGRKPILIFTLYADFITTVFGSFSQSYTFFVITRFLCGFFTGGPGYLLFTYLADFTPRKLRATFICYAGFCFILSWILLPGIGLMVIPLKNDMDIGILKFNSWRLYCLIFTILSLSTAIIISQLPESPRLLSINGQTQKCLKILKLMFVINTGKPEQSYKINFLNADILDLQANKTPQMSFHMQSINHIKNIVNETSLLFRKKFFFKTFNMMFVMFTSMFGCYGLGLWIPEIISKLQNSHHTNISFMSNNKNDHELFIKNNSNSSFSVERIYENKSEENLSCENVNSQIFKDTMMVGMACLCYNFVTACLSQHINARYLSSISMVFGGLGALFFALLHSPTLQLTAISIFLSAITTANVILISVIIEAFPSNLSFIAVCLATLSGRIGAICSNLCFGILIEISYYYPIFTVAGLSFSGAFIIIFIKKYEDITINLETSENEDNENNTNLDSVAAHI